MAQKVSWVASEGVKTAHIQLDPPELGSLTIKVTMDQDGNTHVSFVAANAQSRDVIEGQMQRLRDMLQQQGIELDSVDVNVAQDNTAGQQGESYGEDENAARTAGIGNDLEATEDVNVSYIDPADRGIDFYA
jgi:flagellar hook-length control protein FliK